MKKILWIVFCLGLLSVAHAQMESNNYRISTSVVSSGGARMSSANYQKDITVGQPSPVMDPINQPWSQYYELYPGFWYTIAFYETPQKLKAMPWIPLLLLNE